jgi:AbrB family looped-hinge helix DNA binding protein
LVILPSMSMTRLAKVGTKGQVVIAKEIRDELGIGPGAEAVQLVVDGHVELRFLPARHNRSLAGTLAPYIKRSIGPTDEDWHQAREEGWAHQGREAMKYEDYEERKQP